MACLLLLVMLTACAASPQDLYGKMFTFPKETNTAHVKLSTSTQSFSAVTVCLRFITDLSRSHSLFSLATSSAFNGFLIFKPAGNDIIQLYVDNKVTNFVRQDYTLNTWHSVCATWDAASGLGQLWFDKNTSVRKFIGGSHLSNPVVILGQEQDTHGGGFSTDQSFVGMMSDVHMWNYILLPSEIRKYVDDLNFTPGNVLNWRALDFETSGKVLIEDNQRTCY